jgi:hypothetical protein
MSIKYIVYYFIYYNFIIKTTAGWLTPRPATATSTFLFIFIVFTFYFLSIITYYIQELLLLLHLFSPTTATTPTTLTLQADCCLLSQR